MKQDHDEQTIHAVQSSRPLTRLAANSVPEVEKECWAEEAATQKLLSSDEAHRLLHDPLRHQVMQNGELSRTRGERESLRAHFSDLYDQAQVGYLTVSKEGLILEAGLISTHLPGKGRGALVGQPFIRFIFPRDRNIYYRCHKELFETGAPKVCEVRIAKDDASHFWAQLEATVAMVPGRAPVCRVVMSDITERKQAEEGLLVSEERFRSLFHGVPAVAVHGYGPDGRIQYWNQASERLYGYTAQEAIGRNVLDLIIPPDMQEVVGQAIRQMAGTGQALPASEQSLVRKDGSRVAVFSSHTIVQIPGCALELFCIDIDLTERKRTEDELRRAKESLQVANRELEKAFAREQQLAYTDALTGVNNYRCLIELATHEFDVAVRYQHPLSVMMFDLDYFKQVNDTFGHAMGDRILERVVQVACAELRSADKIGRYGGDEFIIVLPVTTAQQAYPLAERIRAGVAAIRLPTPQGNAAVTLSIGIAETIHMPHDDAIEHVINRADEAMYAAKKAGRNRTATYTGKTRENEPLTGNEVNPNFARFHPVPPIPQSH